MIVFGFARSENGWEVTYNGGFEPEGSPVYATAREAKQAAEREAAEYRAYINTPSILDAREYYQLESGEGDSCDLYVATYIETIEVQRPTLDRYRSGLAGDTSPH